MIPVRQCEDYLLIKLVFVGELGIVDNDGSTKTIRILTVIVRMIPVCARLINLRKNQKELATCIRLFYF